MAKIKLSEAQIAAMKLPRPGKNYIVRDSEVHGLAVRVTSSGFRSFLFCHSFDGIERRTPIMPWTKGQSTLALARQRAAELRLKVQSGTDLHAEQVEARNARIRAREQAAKEMTVAQLVERFITEHVSHKRSAHQDERRLRTYVIPAWGTRKAKDITRADVDAFVSPVANGPNPRLAEANHRLALVRKMFSFALDKGIIDAHPCLRMKAPGGPTRVRERTLESARELRMFWRITEGGVWSRYISDSEADALRFILLTGCRGTEAAALPWSEIDMDQGLWTLPGARAKNKREHVLPLPAQAMKILRKRAKLGGTYVFPAVRREFLTVDRLGRVLGKACARVARLGLAPFSTHDLRRTVETGMAAAKVPKEYRDRVLNHIDASVGSRHYNKHDYMDEKREALRKWESRLEGMLRGERSNVVPLRRKGA